MTANNDWPGKPGVPLNSEQDGWHWVYHDEGGLECAFWIARSRCWQLVGAEEFFEPFEMAVRRWRYLNPVLTPDQATALQKKGCTRDQKTTQYCADVVDRDKRIAELEAALKPLSCSCTGFCGVMGWLPADNDACARRQGRAALKGKKDE